MSCHRTIARAAIGIFVILLLAVPLLVIEAYGVAADALAAAVAAGRWAGRTSAARAYVHSG